MRNSKNVIGDFACSENQKINWRQYCYGCLEVINVFGKMVITNSTAVLYHINFSSPVSAGIVRMCMRYFNNENKSHQAE
jgi:hypothetical protein